MEVIDCEALRTVWPAQPANAWSALAFLVAGLVFLVAPSRSYDSSWAGGALAATGLGSLLFHGSLTTTTEWAHDASLLILLGVLVLVVGRRTLLTIVTAGFVVVAAGALAGLAPDTTAIASGILVVLALGRERTTFTTRPRLPMLAGAMLLVLGGILAVLGRTGGLLCSADSLLQPHAAWHVLAAAGLVAYAHARGWLGYGTDRGSHT